MASSNFIIAISTQPWSRAVTVEQLRSTLIRFDVTFILPAQLSQLAAIELRYSKANSRFERAIYCPQRDIPFTRAGTERLG